MLFRRLAAALALTLALGSAAFGQGAVLNAGRPVAGHLPIFVGPGTQAVISDSGTAAGGAVGYNPSELGLTIRGSGLPPFADKGSGPFGTNFCTYDAPTTNPTGYHFLCLGPNSQGGGMIAYGAGNGAPALPLTLSINGSTTTLPGGACALCGSMATQSANNVQITGGAISNVTLANPIFASGYVLGGDLQGNLPNPTFNLALPHAWSGQQTFALPPIFTSLVGYVKGNGSGQATASPFVPTTDISGTTLASQEPAHSGDVANPAGSLTLTIAPNAVTNSKLATMPATTLKGNLTSAAAPAADNSLTAYSDAETASTAVGGIIYRGSSALQNLAPANSGYVLTSNGPGVAPSYAPTSTSSPKIFNFSNLKVTNGAAPNSQITVTADSIIIPGATAGIIFSNLSVTCSTSSSGANGLDTGTVAASTGYYVYVISNGTVPACLLSTSLTPALPATYTFKGRVGWNVTDASSNLSRVLQLGRRAQYVVQPSTTLPKLISGALGNINTPTYVAAPTTGLIPPTASTLIGALYSSNAAGLSPNNNYGAYNSTTNPPLLQNSAAGSILFSMVVESVNFYYFSNGSTTVVYVSGWEDNL